MSFGINGMLRKQGGHIRSKMEALSLAGAWCKKKSSFSTTILTERGVTFGTRVQQPHKSVHHSCNPGVG